MNTKTTFAGLELNSPIIAASCSRTANITNNKALCEAGVGAIVLKSLFEENIISQGASMSHDALHCEGVDYLHGYLRSHELNEYINLIKECKKECTVPIIASICAVSHGEWEEFARLIEEAGADAIELNIMGIESSLDYEDGRVERTHEDIVRSIKAQINIPIIVKLGSLITNPVALISRLKACGASAVVLFNRMYASDIDIESMEYVPASPFSTQQDFTTPLRWVGITSARVKNINIALSGGVKSGADVVKSILAGATAVEVCSVLYTEGNSWITKATEEIKEWQQSHGYDTIEEFRANLSAMGKDEAETLTRSQFLRHFGSVQ